jgi:hypothetical protein
MQFKIMAPRGATLVGCYQHSKENNCLNLERKRINSLRIISQMYMNIFCT